MKKVAYVEVTIQQPVDSEVSADRLAKLIVDAIKTVVPLANPIVSKTCRHGLYPEMCRDGCGR